MTERTTIKELEQEIADLKGQLAKASQRASQWYIRATYLEGKLEQYEQAVPDDDDGGDENEPVIVGKWE